jgi:hypothetical protein
MPRRYAILYTRDNEYGNNQNLQKHRDGWILGSKGN